MTLQGSTTYLVRDITDINHPFTVSTLGGLAPMSGPNAAYEPRFVTASDLSYYNDAGQLLRKTFDKSPIQVAGYCNGIPGFAWSPDGLAAAYLTNTRDYSAGELHVVTNGQDRVVASTPRFTPAGCEAAFGCERINARLIYSPNGAYISYVSAWPGPHFRVWTAAGELLAGDDTGFYSWSVWSGDTLYFRTDNGVETWRNGKRSVLLQGVAWVSVAASGAGGELIYHVREASGLAHIEILATVTGSSRELASSRSGPAFLTSRYVWYRGERACQSGDSFPCTAGAPVISNGKTYIFDLQTGTEAESVISDVWDVWPHPA